MSEPEEYNGKYQRLSRKWESMIIGLILIFSILLLTSEILYQFEPVRMFFIETERLEGITETP